jgi:RNA polymerase sigma-70 factor, ECF subfamily
MSERERHSLFSDLMACHQSELYSFIFAAVRNWEDADDLLQSVSLVLWRKFETFRPGSNFLYWARRTAKIEVSNFLRRKHRPGFATDELLDALTETVVEIQNEGIEPYLAALRRCKEKLSPTDEELIELHYVEDLGSRQIADRLQRPQPSVCHSLNRIRAWLFECVQMELARQEHAGKGRS